MGVTHVLNCARGCCGNHDDSFYAPLNIMVQSMEASDSPYAQLPSAVVMHLGHLQRPFVTSASSY